MESEELWLFVNKDLTFKVCGQKDRTATAWVKDINVRNNKAQIGNRNSRKNLSNVQLYLWYLITH